MHIFISYSKQDTRQLTNKLAKQLVQIPNVTIWWDESLRPTLSWSHQIELQIKRCDLFIVLLSQDVNRPRSDTKDSSFVLKEISYAMNNHKIVLPILAQATDVPLVISDLQNIDITHNQAQGIEQIVQFVREFAGSIEKSEKLDQRSGIQSEPGLKRSNIGTLGSIGVVFVILLTVAVLLAIKGNRSSEHSATSTSQAMNEHPNSPSGENVSDLQSDPDATPTTVVLLTPMASLSQSNPTVISSKAPENNTPSSTQSLQPVNTFTEISAMPEMIDGYEYVRVPLGEFQGNSVLEYWIMAYEVTNTQFASFLNVRGNQSVEDRALFNTRGTGNHISSSNGQWQAEPGFENHPVVNVTWYGARDFCESIGGRLPTAIEWQKAASWNPVSNEITVYPWGNDQPNETLANFGMYLSTNTAEVNAYPYGISPVGTYNMSGNVREWIADAQGTNRFWIGGGWNDNATSIRSDSKGAGADTFTTSSSGFRCVRDSR